MSARPCSSTSGWRTSARRSKESSTSTWRQSGRAGRQVRETPAANTIHFVAHRTRTQRNMEMMERRGQRGSRCTNMNIHEERAAKRVKHDGVREEGSSTAGALFTVRLVLPPSSGTRTSGNVRVGSTRRRRGVKLVKRITAMETAYAASPGELNRTKRSAGSCAHSPRERI